MRFLEPQAFSESKQLITTSFNYKQIASEEKSQVE